MATRKETVAVDVKVTGERDLDRLGRTVDDVGDELKGTAKDASNLDRELSRLERTATDLNREFARTGDKGLLKQLKDTKKELAPLQAVRRELDKIAASEEKARLAELKRATTPSRGGGGGVRAGVGGLSLPLSPTTLAIGGLAGVGLSLPVLAGAGGAILGGAGIGAGALGVAGAAARNPMIGRSAQGALEDETRRWQQASRAFEEPTLRAIKNIKAAVDDVPLEEILKNAAEFIDPLSEGLAGFIKNFGEGFGELIEDARPVIDVIATELPRLGKSFEVMFDEIGQGSEGGAEALEDILHVVERLIIGTGKIIHFFEDAYGAGVKLRQALPGDLWNDDEVKIHGFGRAIGAAAVQFDHMAGSAEDAQRAAETFGQTLDRLFGVTMDSVEANLNYEAALDGLTEALKENRGEWDAGTEAGRDHIEATQTAIEEAYRNRQAMIDSGMAVAFADSWFKTATGSIIAQARAAGATEAVIAQLTARWLNFLSQPSTKILNVRVIQTTESSSGGRGAPRGQLPFLASGTPAAPAGLAVVGEEGPELVRFRGGERVFSTAESKRMAANLNGAAGQPFLIRVLVEYPDGRIARDELVNAASNRGQSMRRFLGV